MQVPRTVERTEIQFQTGKEDLLMSFKSEMCKTARASWELQLGYFRRFPSHVTSLSGFDGGVILLQFTLYAVCHVCFMNYAELVVSTVQRGVGEDSGGASD